MNSLPRHQCLIYEGAPSRHLLAIAAVVRQRLKDGYRCLYLNSRPMVAGLRSYLAAAGVDVSGEIESNSLVLSSERQDQQDRSFEPAKMIDDLETAVSAALKHGYVGLWASGDMTWEFGLSRDFSMLLQYECMLEDLMQRQPTLSGICQYHTDTLPREATRQGLVIHSSLFINDTMSMVNPHYRPTMSSAELLPRPELDDYIVRLCGPSAP
jgi:hypothetical protein